MTEMSNYRGSKFNLPVNVWVDGPTTMKHTRRIKFQNNYSTNFDETNLLTMTISDEPKVGKVFKKIQIKAKDIEKLKKWVVQNRNVLDQYAQGQLSSGRTSKYVSPLPIKTYGHLFQVVI